MEIRKSRFNEIKGIIISLLAGYFVTLTGVIVLALLLFFFQISEDAVNIGVIVVYILSSFVSGFLMGKQLKVRKFIWGMLVGILYYFILILISFGAKNSFNALEQELITAFVICMGSGTLGGMVS